MGSIKFLSESAEYQLSNKNNIVKWLLFVAKMENVRIEELKYVFVNENEIIEINKKFLTHEYSTDIITFGTNFLGVIYGEIFICLPVIFENSKIYSNNSIFNELLRVIVHGVLHLIGYNDSTDIEIETMREKENMYLAEFIKFE